MKKYWFINENKNYFVGIGKDAIYSGSIKKYIKSELINDFEKGIEPKEIFSIPFSYIKSIENPEGKKKIEIHYGDNSNEEIKIEDLYSKNEIFNSLKNELSKFQYTKNTPSIFKHTKAQIFAILIATGLFIWVFYLANQIAQGYEYEVVGSGKGKGLGGIILGLAQFGTTKVIIGYLLILSIAIAALVRRLKTRVPVEYLIRN